MINDPTWQDLIEVAEVVENGNNKLRITIRKRTYKEKVMERINIREWYFDDKEDKWLPTRRGISAPLNEKYKEAFLKLAEHLKKNSN